MPQQIELNGQQVTVYTEAEHVQARDQAAAAARRQAEAEREAARGELQGLQGQVTSLTQERDTARGEAGRALRVTKGVRLLAGQGLSPAQAEQLLGLPLFGEVDLDQQAAVDAAMASLKETFPVLFASGPAAAGGGQEEAKPFGGAGGSPTGVRKDPTSDDVGQMGMADYIAWRDGGGGR